MLRIARLLLVVIVTLGCGAAPSPPGGAAPGTGVVRGTVLAWPCAPVERPGSPCPGRPAAEVDVTFSTAGGLATTVRSDAGGGYRIELEAGTYTVSVARNRPIRSGGSITVTAGRNVQMDIVYDSGLRLPAAPPSA